VLRELRPAKLLQPPAEYLDLPGPAQLGSGRRAWRVQHAGDTSGDVPSRQARTSRVDRVRLVIARCSVDYAGRLSAHLPLATRLIMVKADGSVLVHSDGGSYKPLNWMSPPCRLAEAEGRWVVTAKSGETLTITIEEILSDSSHELGVDPGLVKDGVESHLQELLAAQLHVLGEGWRLVRREYPTAIGPVDIMCRDAAGVSVAIEIKRRGEIDGVEQLSRYLELLNRDPLLAPVQGIFAAQEIKPQARVLAEDRGIRCVTLDYDTMRGMDDGALRLF
jgi:endonuclease